MQLHEQLKLSRLQYGRSGALVKGQEWPISVGMAQSHVTGRWMRARARLVARVAPSRRFCRYFNR